jgi:hypothetical protein
MMTMIELAQGLGPLLPGSCREDVTDVVIRIVVMVRNDQPPKNAQVEGNKDSGFDSWSVYLGLCGTEIFMHHT